MSLEGAPSVYVFESLLNDLIYPSKDYKKNKRELKLKSIILGLVSPSAPTAISSISSAEPVTTVVSLLLELLAR